MQIQARAHIISSMLALLALGGCAGHSTKDEDMGAKPTGKPAGKLEADPRVYKLNSVKGTVLAGGKPVPGATVTILKTGESFPVPTTGSYVIVLDPVKLGGRGHELVFSAPGYAEQRHFVLVPENNQAYLDVELVPAK